MKLKDRFRVVGLDNYIMDENGALYLQIPLCVYEDEDNGNEMIGEDDLTYDIEYVMDKISKINDEDFFVSFVRQNKIESILDGND